MANRKKSAKGRKARLSAMLSKLNEGLDAKPVTVVKIGPVTRRLTGIVKHNGRKNDRRLLCDALIVRYVL